jgi:uncharacterized protein YneF (UPF0154 family)
MPPDIVFMAITFLMGAASGKKFYFTTIKIQEIMVSRQNPQTNMGSKPSERLVFLTYTKFI